MSGLLKRLLVTPIEVNDAEFTSIMLIHEWYRASEVDELLEAVVETMWKFLNTNRELSRENTELKRVLRKLATAYPDLDQTINDFLKENAQ
jgi:DivIVA domain-containing protein